MNEKGFTLIELLFVLSVLIVLMSIVVPLQFSSFKKLEERLFIERLHSDVLLVQNQASHHEVDYMKLLLFKEYYTLSHTLSGHSEKRSYPEGWSFRSEYDDLQFNHTGSVRRPRKVHLKTEEGYVFIVFPLGKGRFWVDESERIYTD